MDALNEDNYSGKAIDHLGLVADIIDDLDIIQLIDDRLPLTEGCGSKVTMLGTPQKIYSMIKSAPAKHFSLS